MKKKRLINRKSSRSSNVAFGTFASFIMLMVASFFVSLVLSRTKSPIDSLAVGSLISLLLAGAISGFFIGKRYKSLGTAAFSSIIFVVALLVFSLVSEKGSISGTAFMNAVCYLLISLFTAFIGIRKRRRLKR